MFVHLNPIENKRMSRRRGAKQHTQTLKFRFLYVTDSTLNPIVGIVVTTSPIYHPSAKSAQVEREEMANLQSVEKSSLSRIILHATKSVLIHEIPQQKKQTSPRIK